MKDEVEYLSGKSKVRRVVKKSGLVKLKPRITGSRSKKTSLIADHIVEATNKGKPIKPFFIISIYIKIRDAIRLWVKQ